MDQVEKAVHEVLEENEDVLTRLESWEQENKVVRTKCSFWIAGLFLVEIAILLLLLILNALSAVPLIFLAIGFIVGVIILSSVFKEPHDVEKEYADTIFKSLLKKVSPDLEFRRREFLAEHVYKKAALHSRNYDRYRGEDLLFGKVGKTEFQASHLHVQRKEETRSSDGRTRTRWVTVFEGILFVADFHKDFNYDIRVLPDVAEKNFGWIGRKLQGLGGSLMQMENPDFEKHYKVNSNNAQAAHYVLTPDMQERLLRMHSVYGEGVRFLFSESKVFLTLPQKNLEMDRHPKAAFRDPRELIRIYNEINFVTQIVDLLDLNTRIWSKE